MQKQQLEDFKRWFAEYAAGFYADDAFVNANLRLKEAHTRRVCDEMNYLTESLGLTESQRVVAETIALFHDLGRYEQFTKYRTFSDARSVPHGPLALEVLARCDVLEGVKPRLTVRSSPIPVVSIRGDKSGFTPFADDCDWYTQVGLMAPKRARLGGKDYDFVRWEVDATAKRPGRNSIKLAMDTDHIVRAVYENKDKADATGSSPVVGSTDADAAPLAATEPAVGGPDPGYGWDAALAGLLVVVLLVFGVMLWRAGAKQA